ncbi:histidinol-phosphatase HisJ family protein [Lentibacillus sp. N15]|uniref:histidinol-phosphatase HisJ family protein n=1 Tax=Lentibacillus songyuanensis TaxID=3136161 RepID=UPI0031BB582D
MFDYHVHSVFSADCEEPMEKSVQRAIALGLQEICFTEHIDYDYPDPTIVFDLDLSAYTRKMTSLQKQYGEQITIKKGVEIGVQPHLLDRYRQLIAQETFDFVICSMHTAHQQDLHSGAFFAEKSVDEAFAAYYRELLYCVKSYKKYQILGHLDLVKRYTREIPTNDFHDIIREIFRVIIADGKGIELNTSGVRYGLANGLPSEDILELYKECGGEIITLGSDSHQAETIAFQFQESLQLLKHLGYRYITTFTKGEAQQHPIEEII